MNATNMTTLDRIYAMEKYYRRKLAELRVKKSVEYRKLDAAWAKECRGMRRRR